MFTGGFENRSRSELNRLAESLGAKLLAVLVKNLDFLLWGLKNQLIRKINEAKSLNIKVLSEEDWNKIIN